MNVLILSTLIIQSKVRSQFSLFDIPSNLTPYQQGDVEGTWTHLSYHHTQLKFASGNWMSSYDRFHFFWLPYLDHCLIDEQTVLIWHPIKKKFNSTIGITGLTHGSLLSPNRPTELIPSSSRNVRVFLVELWWQCFSPSHGIFFKAYHCPQVTLSV